jgi:hypothetical protein
MTIVKDICRVVYIGSAAHKIKRLTETWCGREIKGDRLVLVGLVTCKTCRKSSEPHDSINKVRTAGL